MSGCLRRCPYQSEEPDTRFALRAAEPGSTPTFWLDHVLDGADHSPEVPGDVAATVVDRMRRRTTAVVVFVSG